MKKMILFAILCSAIIWGGVYGIYKGVQHVIESRLGPQVRPSELQAEEIGSAWDGRAAAAKEWQDEVMEVRRALTVPADFEWNEEKQDYEAPKGTTGPEIKPTPLQIDAMRLFAKQYKVKDALLGTTVLRVRKEMGLSDKYLYDPQQGQFAIPAPPKK